MLWTLGPHGWEATALHEVFAPCSPKTACLSAFSVLRDPAGAILTGSGKTLKQNRKLDKMKSFETQAPGLRGSTPFEPTTTGKYHFYQVPFILLLLLFHLWDPIKVSTKI